MRQRRSSSPRDADLFLCEATYQNDSELAYFHLSALQAAEHAQAGGAAAPGADAHHAEPRPRALVGGGGRGVHRRDRHGGARHGDRGRRVSRPDGRAARRAAAGARRARVPGMGRGLDPVLDGQDARAVRGVGLRRPAAMAPRHRQGLGDGGVLDAARRPRTSGRSARSTRAVPAGARRRSSASIGRVAPQRDRPARRWGSARSRSTATCCRPTPARARHRSPAATSRSRSRCAASKLEPDDAARLGRRRQRRDRRRARLGSISATRRTRGPMSTSTS